MPSGNHRKTTIEKGRTMRRKRSHQKQRAFFVISSSSSSSSSMKVVVLFQKLLFLLCLVFVSTSTTTSNNNVDRIMVNGENATSSIIIDPSKCSVDCGPFGSCQMKHPNDLACIEKWTDEWNTCEWHCKCNDDQYAGMDCSRLSQVCNTHEELQMDQSNLLICYNGGTCTTATNTNEFDGGNNNNNNTNNYTCNCLDDNNHNNNDISTIYTGNQCDYALKSSCVIGVPSNPYSYCFNNGICRKMYTAEHVQAAMNNDEKNHFIIQHIPCDCTNTSYEGRYCQFPIGTSPIEEMQYVDDILEEFHQQYTDNVQVYNNQQHVYTAPVESNPNDSNNNNNSSSSSASPGTHTDPSKYNNSTKSGSSSVTIFLLFVFIIVLAIILTRYVVHLLERRSLTRHAMHVINLEDDAFQINDDYDDDNGNEYNDDYQDSITYRDKGGGGGMAAKAAVELTNKSNIKNTSDNSKNGNNKGTMSRHNDDEDIDQII